MPRACSGYPAVAPRVPVALPTPETGRGQAEHPGWGRTPGWGQTPGQGPIWLPKSLYTIPAKFQAHKADPQHRRGTCGTPTWP